MCNNCFVAVSDEHMYAKQPSQQVPSVAIDVEEADNQLELQLLQDDQLPTDMDCDTSSPEKKLQELQREVQRLKRLVYSFFTFVLFGLKLVHKFICAFFRLGE